MPNLYSHREENIWKTWVFLGFFSVLVLGFGWFLAFFYANAYIFVFAVLLAIFGNFFSYWYADKLVLKLHKAHPVTREEYFDLWNATENLSITAGLPMPKLYIIEDASPNAFATGRDKDHAVICVTTGLLKILNKNELEGVLAHELSHIGNNDMLLSTIVVVLGGFVALLSNFFLRSGSFRGRDRNDNNGLIMIVGVVLAILAPLAATLIRLAISRQREFLADASGALLTRYPEGLASALQKISQSGEPLKSANDATAHLFIANPFGNNKEGSLHKLFLTHPPVAERIHALIDVKDDSSRTRQGRTSEAS